MDEGIKKNNYSINKCVSDSPGNSEELDKTARQLSNLVKIGLALSAEKNHDSLMEMIITEALRITNSDAGTLYLKEGEQLRMKIVHNHTLNIYQGGSGEKVDLPAVPLNPAFASAYVALEGKPVNIADVYTVKGFDFSGACRYDQMTGYRTTSMLVIPLKNHMDDVIGVLQLINAIDENTKKVISFEKGHETIIGALASLAAIALTNALLIEEIENIFEAFVQVMVTAIDEQTPYNASHTRKVSVLARLLAEEINNVNEGVYKYEHFDRERLKNLSMAGWFHDIGKIATPMEVMNKATRLDIRLPLILQRLEYAIEKEMRLSLEYQIKKLKNGQMEEAQREEKDLMIRIDKLQAAKDLIIRVDNPGTFVDEDIQGQIKELSTLTYSDENEKKCSLLHASEIEHLSVVKGTLTAEERRIIEEHVLITEKMLSKIPFSSKLANVPMFACMHHEYLDGMGYPKGIKGEEIPLEARILAITDIFDALTASDRPYKKAIPEEKAAWIIKQMADEGKLDGDLVDIFIQGKVWAGAHVEDE